MAASASRFWHFLGGGVSALRERVAGRFFERMCGRPIINNVARGLYVECMVELALKDDDPAWHLTDAWGGWDLEHSETLARVEVKQSVAAQTWKAVKRSPTFGIPPRERWWTAQGLIGSRLGLSVSRMCTCSCGTPGPTRAGRITATLISGSSTWWPRETSSSNP